MDIHALCRICLQASDNLTSIHIEDEAQITAADKIKQATQLELKFLPNLPEQICDSCLQDLDTAYRFRMNCETTEEILEQYIDAEAAAEGTPDEPDDDNKTELLVEYLEEAELKTEVEDLIIVEKAYDPVKVEGEKYVIETSKPNPKRLDGGAKTWTCFICGVVHKTKNEYTNHVKRHLGEKDFRCRYCPSTFVDRTSLVRHTRKHTGEKPYACHFCTQRFSDYTTVKRHLRTHTGEKPYKCKQCDKSFSLACVLQRHEQAIHYGIKKYECNKCGKKFGQSHHLKQHNNVHLKEEGKPYTKYVRKKQHKPTMIIIENEELPNSDNEMEVTDADEV